MVSIESSDKRCTFRRKVFQSFLRIFLLLRQIATFRHFAHCTVPCGRKYMNVIATEHFNMVTRIPYSTPVYNFWTYGSSVMNGRRNFNAPLTSIRDLFVTGMYPASMQWTQPRTSTRICTMGTVGMFKCLPVCFELAQPPCFWKTSRTSHGGQNTSSPQSFAKTTTTTTRHTSVCNKRKTNRATLARRCQRILWTSPATASRTTFRSFA